MDIITRERALRNLAQLTSPTAAELLAIDTMIGAASRAIERHCGRSFGIEERDELYHGVDSPRLLLRDFPLVAVERVAYEPTAVLTVTNTSSANQRATVKVTAEHLELVHVASGTTMRTQLALASAATLSGLATNVASIGSGWSATVLHSADANRRAQDQRGPQGAFGCKDVAAELRIHLQELTDFDIDSRLGALVLGAGGLDLAGDGRSWSGGLNYWRVIYTSGFAAVPDDVQEACAQWTAALFWSSKRDPGLAGETLVGAVARRPFTAISPAILALLRPYRRHAILSLGG